ncbi:MAG: TetR/AcrR family transcriptional regulator [Neisseriaceae bacterium]|nr:MAG: TetR/AcrR family transcriptional regulator [Neisseriaceae bacterium]
MVVLNDSPALIHQRIVEALQMLAAELPLAEISYAAIAARTGVSWQRVKQVLGPRAAFGDWLAIKAGVAETPASDTRQRIIASAATVFARKGYHGASLDQVAADAGLTKGAVYWHFQSKSDLFLALLDARFQRDMSEMAVKVDAAHNQADPFDSLKLVLLQLADKIESDRDWPRLFLEFLGHAREDAVHQRIGAIYRQSYAWSQTLLDDLRQRGRSNQHADSFVASVFWGALVDGLVLAWLANPQLIDLKQLMPQIAELVWQGVGPRQADLPSSSSNSSVGQD